MSRRFLFFLMLAAACAGCRVCDHPYDYCGPVVDNGFHPAGFRAGSRPGMPTMAPEVIPAPPSPPTAPANSSASLQDDPPPRMGDAQNVTALRSRLRYAR